MITLDIQVLEGEKVTVVQFTAFGLEHQILSSLQISDAFFLAVTADIITEFLLEGLCVKTT